MDNTQVMRYIPEIVERLMQIEPTRVILFGSGADSTASEANDIDLIVVTKSAQLPANHREKESIYLEVAALLRDIRRKAPMDLIVHTQAMHDKFIALNSLFAREVLQHGVIICESHHG